MVNGNNGYEYKNTQEIHFKIMKKGYKHKAAGLSPNWRVKYNKLNHTHVSR